MVQYKWVALSNTTIGVLMASINSTIVLISLPAIFNGIHVNPFTSFQYLLWILFGYNIVTATLLVTFGRLSDIYGRVRLYNAGFLVFTVGSVLLFLTPSTGSAGALEMVIFRLVQGLGAAFLFSNSAAIITDAFPANERGRALGLNQVAALAGSFIGLVLGGVLASWDWRYVFLVSVPIGVIGTAWSYASLREVGALSRGEGIDLWGNATFAAGLTLILVAMTYGILPYGSSPMGWYDPWVIAGLAAGAALLIAFVYVETKVRYPMFRLDLFRNREFAAGNIAALLGSLGRGGVMIVLIILLQGVWLPLHGYSFESTPFWAGVYMIPMTLGFMALGPLSGALSDRHGARALAALGMALTAASFIALAFLPYDFQYLPFALLLFIMGAGNGMFASPNTSSIMGSVKPHERGVASGIRSTLQNAGMTLSMAIYFAVMIGTLASGLPSAMYASLAAAGAPGQLTALVSKIPPTAALFAAFLGYNPVGMMLSQYPQLVASIPGSVLSAITAARWFPAVLGPPLMGSLRASFYLAAAMAALAAVASAVSERRR